MTSTVHVTSYGAAAYRALRSAVREAKDGDPLAPVTLIVPSERIGVAARRALARGVYGDRPGVAAVQVVTLKRFAEMTGGTELARSGRRPLTGPLLIGALRSVLAEEPGTFAPVADHIGTARALARAYRDLRPLPDDVRERLGAEGGVVGDTVRVYRALERRITPRSFDEVDLLRAATRTIEQQGVAGTVVVFLPQDLDAPESALLGALGRTTDLRIVVGLTGDERADAGPLRTCERLGHPVAPDAQPPLADAVLHASDPDDEVREVVRRVVAALGDHPGNRVAVLYGTANPYARLLHEHLDHAGVPAFGRSPQPTAETRFGRALLRLVSLLDHDFRRDEVMALVSDAPVRHDGSPAPSSAWERVSRAAGVVHGDDWMRLRDHAERRRVWLRDHPDADEESRARAERTAEHADALHAFVTTLRDDLERFDETATWRELAEELRGLWSRTLEPDDTTGLPAEEGRALERIDGLWASIGQLDGVAGAPEAAFFRQLLELELTDDVERVGRIGEGVHVGPVSEGVGDDVDAVFVVGAAEGLLPSRQRDDPLLPDRVRVLTSGALPTQAERVARQQRHVLAALAAAPPGGRTYSFPRGDLRLGGARVPSRWVLPSMRALSERGDLAATDWEQGAGLDEVPSYAGAIERLTAPATPQEWRQRAAVDQDAVAPADAVLLRAREVRAARASDRFTVFDGNLAGEALPDPSAGHVVSVTSLESWVHCPHGYFVRYLLGVTEVEQPEQVVRISALERGNVMHDILERMVRQAADEGWSPGPGEPWPARADEVLDAAADERFHRAESEGVTGFSLLWEHDREAMRSDLHAWLEQDNRRRRDLGGLAPVAAEWVFDGTEIPLPDGRTLRVRGRIDRVDRAADGSLVVTDYKTGKAGPYRVLTTDPCDRGQRLQLPVYALAGRAGLGEATTPVRAEYWFTSRRAGFERIGYPVDEGVLEQAGRALVTAVDGIRGGVFLARPNDNGNALYQCAGCDPDGLGEHGVATAWDAKAAARELAALRELLGEEVPA